MLSKKFLWNNLPTNCEKRTRARSRSRNSTAAIANLTAALPLTLQSRTSAWMSIRHHYCMGVWMHVWPSFPANFWQPLKTEFAQGGVARIPCSLQHSHCDQKILHIAWEMVHPKITLGSFINHVDSFLDISYPPTPCFEDRFTKYGLCCNMDIWVTPSPFHVHMVYECPLDML